MAGFATTRLPRTTVDRSAAQTSWRNTALPLVAMLLAVSMTFIDQTIVAIAAPTIASELSLGRAGTQWVINAYLLALAAAFAFGGRLADVIGSRRMVLIGIVGFAGSSALCGATPTGRFAEGWIVAFRALQGVFGAIMIPAALAVVVAAFPLHRRGRALAVFFAVSGGMTSIGPIAGGYLTSWTWRAIFWINVPVAVLALIATTFAHIPRVCRKEAIDFRGAALVALGMLLSILGFQQAQAWGWRSVATWACLVGGLVVLASFVMIEAHTRSPLVRVDIFRELAFFVDNGVLFCSMVAFVPVFFFASVYSQLSLGYDAGRAGLYLLVFFVGFAPAAQVGGRLLDRTGARRPMVLGSAMAATGFALWAGRLHHLGLGAQWPFIVLTGAGFGLLLGPASTDAVNRARAASYGEVTGVTQTVRNYASSLGLAIFGTVFTTVLAMRVKDSLIASGVPGHTAQAIAGKVSHGGPDSGTVPGARLHAMVAADVADATTWVFFGMAVVLGACFLVALRYPRHVDPAEARTDGPHPPSGKAS